MTENQRWRRLTSVIQNSFYHVKTNRVIALKYMAVYLTYCLIYLLRKLPSLTKSFILADTQMGFTTSDLGLIESGFFLTYTIFQILSGTFIDLYGPGLVLIVALTISGIAAIAVAYGTDLVHILGPWTVEGFGHAPTFSALVVYISMYMPSDRQSSLISLFCSSQQLGSVVVGIMGTTICKHWGWRAAYKVMGGVLLAWGPIIYAIMPSRKDFQLEQKNKSETPKVTTDVDSGSADRGFVRRFLMTLRMRGIFRLGCTYFSIKAVRYCLLMWLPTLITRGCYTTPELGGYVSVVADVSGVAGTFGAAIVMNKTQRHFVVGRVILLACAASGLCLWLALVQEQPSVAIVAICASTLNLMISAGDSLFGAVGPIVVIDQECTDRDVSGTAMAIVNGVGSAGGLIQGMVVPFLLSRFGEKWYLIALFLVSNMLVAVVLNQGLIAQQSENMTPNL